MSTYTGAESATGASSPQNQKKCEYIGCDTVLVGKQRRFCSDEHRRLHDRMVNKPYYVKYSREYMRKYREENRRVKYCVQCGAKLPKYAKKYCSVGCRIKYYIKSGHFEEDNRHAVMQLFFPDACPECGGRIIKDKYDVVCSDCGLVQE